MSILGKIEGAHTVIDENLGLLEYNLMLPG
jgi:hypothetical protein